MTSSDIFLSMREVSIRGKMSADEKRVRGRKKFLTDSERIRNRKEVLARYNKTKINIGNQHGRWIKLREALRVHTHAEVAEKLLNW